MGDDRNIRNREKSLELMEDISADMDGQWRSAHYLFTQLIDVPDISEAHNLGSLLNCLASNIREVKAKLDAAIEDAMRERRAGQ